MSGAVVWTGASVPRVLALMATRNGEPRLAEQIASIFGQRGVELVLRVSDDRSTDGTVALLRQLGLARPDLHVEVREVGSGSAGANFKRVLATSDFTGFDYVALADQDDLWDQDHLQLRIDAAIRWLGAIPASALPAVHRGAHALAFISRYEGFGFPIIEAMGCGTPVLTSDAASMPEVAGGAAILVDLDDCDAVVDGLLRVCAEGERRDALKAAGLMRASVFGWERTAAAYWSALGAPPVRPETGGRGHWR